MWLFVILVVALPLVVFGVVSWFESRVSRLPVMGPEGHTVSAFSFVNQRGDTLNSRHWKDKIVVANFFFTHCPVVCPKMTKNLTAVQAALGDEVLLNSFSVDPERDDVNRLNGYAARFDIGKNWNLLTGDKKELYRFARKDLMIVATDGNGGEDDFIHSENLVLVDKKKRIRGYYKGTSEKDTQQLIIDIKKLLKE